MSILRSKHSGWTWEGRRTPFGGGSGGGGGPTQSTTVTSNIPEYARPYVEQMLGAAQQQAYTFGPEGQVTGFKPYIPYGATVGPGGQITNTAQEQAAAAVAGFSPMQEQAFRQVAGMQVPGQIGLGSQYVGAAGAGALGVQPQAGVLGQQALGYGATGAEYGGLGAEQALARARQTARQADIYGRMGAGYGGRGVEAAEQGFGAGARYEQMATSPYAQQAFMSPYMQNVVDVQKQEAIRDYEKAMPGLQAQAARAGAFGGSRQAIEAAEARRNLGTQLGQIQAQGTQRAFEQAQQAQQFGANLGLQGLQAGYGGLGLGMQGAGIGLQGVGAQQAAGQLGLAGTAQGMQGAGMGLQGIGQAIGAGQYGLQGLGAATQAGTALGQLGAQQLAAQQGIIGLQTQAGAQQQALEQQRINQAIQNYALQQQYPQLQLSTMSSLLRGLPLQQATTQQYQAPPSAISQIGGLGAAGVGLYGMGRSAGIFGKEGGHVRKLASGGITGMSKKVLMNPDDFSIKQVDEMTKKGMISKLVGAPVLDAKMKDEQRIKLAQAAQQPKPIDTIAADIMARAAAQGIDNAPSNLPVMSAFDGGIVAMADGGEVDEDGVARYNEGGKSAFREDLEKFGKYALPDIDPITKKLRELGSYFTKPRQSTTSPGDVEVQSGYTPSSAPAPFPAEPAKPRILEDLKPSAAAAPVMPESTVDTSGKGIADILKKFQEGQAASAGKDVEDKKMAFWSSLAQLGLGAMGGTSPYAAVNIGQAGAPAVASGMQQLREIRGREEKRGIAGLQAALEGEKIKADYTKLGLQAPYLQAMAEYYKRRPGTTGTAGLGSVTPAVADKVMTRFQGYEADPKSAPFFSALPRNVQQGLTDYGPKTESYKRAMEEFRKYNDRAMQNYLNSLRGLSAKTSISADES